MIIMRGGALASSLLSRVLKRQRIGSISSEMLANWIEAIELADNLTTDPKHPIPIDCHWIWTDDPDKFEVFITHNARQVTRILLTPRPPTNPALPLIALAPYFVV